MKALTLPFLLGLTACQSSQRLPLTCTEASDPKTIVQRCIGGDLKKGHFIGDTACFPFSSSERLSGTWHVELEGSFFIPSGGDAKSKDVWLEVENPPRLATQSMQGDMPRDFAVELIGRRSLCKGVFGHMGMMPREIVAEKFLSIRLKSAE